jgi:hypothetical protein
MAEITLPAGLRAEHTIVHPNVNGCTLVMGVERITVGDPDPAGRVPMTVAIEWVASIHLPPAALKRLQQQLNEIVGHYEGRFGPIPQDLPQPPRPTLSLVRDQPEAPQTEGLSAEPQKVAAASVTYEDVRAAVKALPKDRFGFRSLYRHEPPSEQTAPQDHRPQSGECPPDEPAPSPSEPTP